MKLQQDSRNKLSVELDENVIINNLKIYFKWRKDISIKRLMKLGTHDYNNFIEFLYNKFGN